jgi:hypothetical protein
VKRISLPINEGSEAEMETIPELSTLDVINESNVVGKERILQAIGHPSIVYLSSVSIAGSRMDYPLIVMRTEALD